MLWWPEVGGANKRLKAILFFQQAVAKTDAASYGVLIEVYGDKRERGYCFKAGQCLIKGGWQIATPLSNLVFNIRGFKS